MFRREFRDHLTIIGGSAEYLRVERDYGDRLAFESLGDVVHTYFWALWHADLVETVLWLAIVRPRRFKEIQQILDIAQVGEVGTGDDQDLVGVNQVAFRPDGPLVPDIKDDAGYGCP